MEQKVEGKQLDANFLSELFTLIYLACRFIAIWLLLPMVTRHNPAVAQMIGSYSMPIAAIPPVVTALWALVNKKATSLQRMSFLIFWLLVDIAILCIFAMKIINIPIC